MGKTEEKISTSRRNILKRATLAVATVAASGGMVTSVQARAQDACGISSTEGPRHLPIPKQAPATEDVRECIEMEEKSKGKGPRVHQRAKSKITWDKIRALKIPTFFIAGGADLIQPPSMMRAAAREIPGSETLVVAEAGHAVRWEQPELFNRVVIEFFRKHS